MGSKKSFRPGRILVLLSIVTIECISGPVYSSDELLRRFQSEAPPAWAEYVSLVSKGLEVKVAGKTVDRTNKDAIVHSSNSVVVLANPLFSCITTSGTDSGGNLRKQAIVVNSKYQFTVRGKQLKDWRIGSIDVGQPTDGLFDRGTLGSRNERCMALRTVCKGLFINITFFPAMVRQSSFRVLDASHLSKDRRSLVKVEFKYRGNEGNDIVGDGSVLLEPERYWQIEEAHVAAHWSDATGIIDISNEFSDAEVGLPVVIRQTWVQRSGTGKDRVDLLIESKLDWNKLESVPKEADFTLTSYGFVEPGLDAARRRIAILVVNVVAIVLLCAGIMVRRLAKR